MRNKKIRRGRYAAIVVTNSSTSSNSSVFETLKLLNNSNTLVSVLQKYTPHIFGTIFLNILSDRVMHMIF